jgi:N-acetylglucosaminyldiphosphoundecaprenol N-acetyl-beta-D-mannosaminyltransferase
VGAAFNFHAGTVRQAPRWLQHSGLEWLFRLVMEPRRLWKRYLIGNPRFAFLVLKQLCWPGKDPWTNPQSPP